MTDQPQHDERRRHPRYETKIDIQFYVTYDIQTKVEYQVLAEEGEGKWHPAVGQNASAGGLSFVSEQELEKDSRLKLAVFIPGKNDPVNMLGEVAWSKKMVEKKDSRDQYMTGIRLLEVNGKTVANTIEFDKEYKIVWSSVLDAVFGNFRNFVDKENPPHNV
jgi:hypothetical protein